MIQVDEGNAEKSASLLNKLTECVSQLAADLIGTQVGRHHTFHLLLPNNLECEILT